MATGGGDLIDFENDNPYLDHKIDHDDDDEEQEVNRTQPFTPQQSSTPYHVSEQIHMQTMQHEQSGMPSYEETSLLGDSDPIGKLHEESTLRRKMKKAIDTIISKYPKADFEKINIRTGKDKSLGKIVAIGPKGGQYQILKNDDSDFTKHLGPSAEQIIAEDRDTIQEQSQRLAEAEKQ